MSANEPPGYGRDRKGHFFIKHISTWPDRNDLALPFTNTNTAVFLHKYYTPAGGHHEKKMTIPSRPLTATETYYAMIRGLAITRTRLFPCKRKSCKKVFFYEERYPFVDLRPGNRPMADMQLSGGELTWRLIRELCFKIDQTDDVSFDISQPSLVNFDQRSKGGY